MFSPEYFSNLFKKYPLLERFLGQDIQTSTDSQKTPSYFNDSDLNHWQKALYAFIAKSYKNKVLVRYFELERTLLSILFLETLKNPENLSSLTEKRVGLTPEDIDKLCTLAAEVGVNVGQKDEAYELLVLSNITGDICKIDEVRAFFKAQGVLSADQDIAWGDALALHTETLATYLALTTDQITHLKTHAFPFHLGHAAQAECAPIKFVNIHAILKTLAPDVAKKWINYAILKQVLDVAGARAQTGDLLLNSAILKVYLDLRSVLLSLISEEAAPAAIYWEYVTRPITDIVFTDPNLRIKQQTDFNNIDTYAEKGLVWRFCRLLRIIERPASRAQEALEIESIIKKLLQNPRYIAIFEKWRHYDAVAMHTFTYFPAIFSTLRDKVAQNKNEYAIENGLIILGLAIDGYLAAAQSDRALWQSPLCFNQLNGLLKNDPTLVEALASGNQLLDMQTDGNIKIISNDRGIVAKKSTDEEKKPEPTIVTKAALFQPQMLSTLENIFAAYQFSSATASRLIRLFCLAGAFSPERLTVDLKAVGADSAEISEALAVISEMKTLAPELLLKYLFAKPQSKQDIGPWPRTAHLWLLRVAQWVLFARENHQERWEMVNLAWMENNSGEVDDFINRSGIAESKMPEKQSTVAVILGANFFEMRRRIIFAKEQAAKIGDIYLLTGDRVVNEVVDGKAGIADAKNFFSKVSVDTVIPYFAHLPDDIKNTTAENFISAQQNNLTEAGIMLYLAIENDLPCRLINTPPSAPLNKPTTITTVRQFIAEIKTPVPAALTVITSAPWLRSQQADVALVMADNDAWRETTLQTVGPQAASVDEFLEWYPSVDPKLYHHVILEPLGGYFFGAFSASARQLGYKGDRETLNHLCAMHGFSEQKKQAKQLAATPPVVSTRVAI